MVNLFLQLFRIYVYLVTLHAYCVLLRQLTVRSVVLIIIYMFQAIYVHNNVLLVISKIQP